MKIKQASDRLAELRKRIFLRDILSLAIVCLLLAVFISVLVAISLISPITFSMLSGPHLAALVAIHFLILASVFFPLFGIGVMDLRNIGNLFFEMDFRVKAGRLIEAEREFRLKRKRAALESEKWRRKVEKAANITLLNADLEKTGLINQEDERKIETPLEMAARIRLLEDALREARHALKTSHYEPNTVELKREQWEVIELCNCLLGDANGQGKRTLL